jgi:hypothetical protein
MATPTLANPAQPEQSYTGNLIDDLLRTVEQTEKPKPPQGVPQPSAEPEAESDLEMERRLRG